MISILYLKSATDKKIKISKGFLLNCIQDAFFTSGTQVQKSCIATTDTSKMFSTGQGLFQMVNMHLSVLSVLYFYLRSWPIIINWEYYTLNSLKLDFKNITILSKIFFHTMNNMYMYMRIFKHCQNYCKT